MLSQQCSLLLPSVSQLLMLLAAYLACGCVPHLANYALAPFTGAARLSASRLELYAVRAVHACSVFSYIPHILTRFTDVAAAVSQCCLIGYCSPCCSFDRLLDRCYHDAAVGWL